MSDNPILKTTETEGAQEEKNADTFENQVEDKKEVKEPKLSEGGTEQESTVTEEEKKGNIHEGAVDGNENAPENQHETKEVEQTGENVKGIENGSTETEEEETKGGTRDVTVEEKIEDTSVTQDEYKGVEETGQREVKQGSIVIEEEKTEDTRGSTEEEEAELKDHRIDPQVEDGQVQESAVPEQSSRQSVSESLDIIKSRESVKQETLEEIEKTVEQRSTENEESRLESINEPGEMFIQRESTKSIKRSGSHRISLNVGVGTEPRSDKDDVCKRLFDVQKSIYDRENEKCVNGQSQLAELYIYLGEEIIYSGIVNRSFPLSLLLKKVSGMTGLPPDSFMFTWRGQPLNSFKPLNQLAIRNENYFNLHLVPLIPGNLFSPEEIPCEYYPEESEINVLIEDLDLTKKNANVTIQNVCFTREWCGGFRNRDNGLLYLNMWTQTKPLDRSWHYPPGVKPPTLYARSAQTHLPYKTTGTNTSETKGIQMSRSDYFIPSASDMVLAARKYESYDERVVRLDLHGKAAIIQRWFRIWRLKKSLKILSETSNVQREMIERHKKKRQSDILKHRESLMVGMAYPVDRKDFYNLYSLLFRWKKKRLEEIRRIADGSTRKALLCQMHDEEVKMVYDIETHKIRSRNERLRRKDLAILEWAGQPKVRNYGKPQKTLMDTSGSQRARMIKEVYCALVRKDLTVNERVDVLLNIRSLLITYDSIDLTIDLIDLVERELDLINAKVPAKHLNGLRMRIEENFRYLIKLPEFNPRLKDAHKSQGNFYKCWGCLKVKSPWDFFVHVRLKVFNLCHSCHWMHNVAHKCLNLAPYQRLLDLTRKDEMKKCCHRSYCFILQPLGMSLLVNTIWNGYSAISASSNITEFRIPRWDKNKDWSPWNCILLTVEEAIRHSALDDIYSFYSKQFCLQVRMKHLIAKAHLVPLLVLDNIVYKNGEWDLIKKENQMLWDIKKRGSFECPDPVFRPPIRKSYKIYPMACPTPGPECNTETERFSLGKAS